MDKKCAVEWQSIIACVEVYRSAMISFQVRSSRMVYKNEAGLLKVGRVRDNQVQRLETHLRHPSYIKVKLIKQNLVGRAHQNTVPCLMRNTLCLVRHKTTFLHLLPLYHGQSLKC
jgi:hypothetical protein